MIVSEATPEPMKIKAQRSGAQNITKKNDIGPPKIITIFHSFKNKNYIIVILRFLPETVTERFHGIFRHIVICEEPVGNPPRSARNVNNTTLTFLDER